MTLAEVAIVLGTWWERALSRQIAGEEISTNAGSGSKSAVKTHCNPLVVYTRQPTPARGSR